MKTKLALLAILGAVLPALGAMAKVPARAIPFILDSHLYIQATVADTIPVSLIYDTGADRLYLDKDYMRLSPLGKLPLRKGMAQMGGAGNSGAKPIPIVIDPLRLKMGSVDYRETITPIIGLREILGRYADGMIGNNAVLGKPLMVNYTSGYLLQLDSLAPSVLEGYTRLPARLENNRIYVECELDVDSLQRLKGDFLLDLGCGGTVVLTNETRKKLDLSGKPQAECYFSNLGVGGSGTTVDFRTASFKFLDQLRNVVVSASRSTQGALSRRPYLGLIGNDILRHYDLIIDAAGKALYARRNSVADSSYQHSSRMQMGYVDRTDIAQGWIVSSLYAGGVAEKAGFEIGDTIISINGRPVNGITWEEQRKGLGLKGSTTIEVKKKNGTRATLVINIDKEII